MQKISFLKLAIFTAFVATSAYAQEINFAWLQREPLKNWPTEETLFITTPLFDVSLTAADSVGESCSTPLLSKESYLAILKHFQESTLPGLEKAFALLNNVNPKYKSAISKALPFRIILELRSDLSCSGSATTTLDELDQTTSSIKREIIMGLGTPLAHYEGFDEVVYHEAGHYLSSLFILRTHVMGVPLEESISDAFAIWAHTNKPNYGEWDQAVINEWKRNLSEFQPDTFDWVSAFHNLESSNAPYMRDFEKEFKLNRFYIYSESHFTSSVVNHAFYQLSTPQNYHQILERFLWLLAEKPELFTSNRLDLIMKEFSSFNVTTLIRLGWLDSFEPIKASQSFKRTDYKDRVKFSFNQTSLVMDASAVSNPYKVRMIPYDIRLNGKSFYATSSTPLEDEQIVLRKVSQCLYQYANLPCICMKPNDVLSLKYYFNKKDKGYLETNEIKIPLDSETACYEMDSYYEED